MMLFGSVYYLFIFLPSDGSAQDTDCECVVGFLGVLILHSQASSHLE